MTNLLLLKVHLLDIHPKIWRRFLVDECLSFFDLHCVLQIVMGWKNAHLHGFEAHGQRIEPENGDWDPSNDSIVSEDDCRLEQVLKRKDRFTYIYDYGDSWTHEILVERVLRLPKESQAYAPLCLDGSRACPPEDCGGSPGYENLLQILADPQDEEYEDMRAWAGNWKPGKFRMDLINRKLSTLQL